MTRHGYTADFVAFKHDNYNSEILPKLTSGEYNVVITPRFIFREGWMLRAFERTIRSNNLIWLYDLDDDTLTDAIKTRNVEYWMQQDLKDVAVPKEQQALYFQVGTEYEQYMRQQLLERVDGVIVSRKPLQYIVEQYTEAPIRVIENAIDPRWFLDRMRGGTIKPFTIGWSGGWRQDQDLNTVASAWADIAARYPAVHFVINGFVSPSLLVSIPSDRLHVLPWVKINDYPTQLQNIDIGCCTVANTDWNKCKSPIKWFEMSIAGSPCVVSDPLYGEYVTNGIDGYVSSSAQDYVVGLSRLIEDRSLREEMASTAQQTILMHHNIEDAWEDWTATIEELSGIAYGYQ